MKISNLLGVVLLGLCSVSYAGYQGCDANNRCTFRFPVNSLETVTINNIAKNHHYNCSIDGTGRLENIDTTSAGTIGLENITAKRINVYLTELEFDSKSLNVELGNLNFNLVCSPGDTPCDETITCSK